jgi:hypothetical protein
MRRDWDLIRNILIKIEDLPPGGSLHSSHLATDEVDETNIAHQMFILNQGGFIEGHCNDTGRGHTCLAKNLTWEGHELLDKIKRDNVWNKIKETARVKGIDLSIDVVKGIATTLLTQILKGGN